MKFTVFLILLALIGCDNENTDSIVTISNNIEFNSQQWKQGDDRVQGSMVENIVSRNLLIGLTREEVNQLLGKPDKEDGNYMGYWVDIGHKFGSEPWPYVLNIIISLETLTVTDAYVAD